MTSITESCESHKVIVVPSTLVKNGERINIGDGAFAKVDIKQGEVVERGIARQIPIDGNNWEMVFTWSDDRSKWATCTGHASYYNTSLQPNTNMTREFSMFDGGNRVATYEIKATRDISAGEALTHTYKSLQWRRKFEEIKDSVDDVQFPPLSSPFPESKVQCDGITVDNFKAFAAKDYDVGDVIEIGIYRVRPGKVDGDFSDYFSLWRIPAEPSDEQEIWALLSGKAMMLTAKKVGEEVNTELKFSREAQHGSFKLVATKAIKQGEELSVVRAGHDKRRASKVSTATSGG
eukprot:gene561-609_t